MLQCLPILLSLKLLASPLLHNQTSSKTRCVCTLFIHVLSSYSFFNPLQPATDLTTHRSPFTRITNSLRATDFNKLFSVFMSFELSSAFDAVDQSLAQPFPWSLWHHTQIIFPYLSDLSLPTFSTSFSFLKCWCPLGSAQGRLALNKHFLWTCPHTSFNDSLIYSSSSVFSFGQTSQQLCLDIPKYLKLRTSKTKFIHSLSLHLFFISWPLYHWLALPLTHLPRLDIGVSSLTLLTSPYQLSHPHIHALPYNQSRLTCEHDYFTTLLKTYSWLPHNPQEKVQPQGTSSASLLSHM